MAEKTDKDKVDMADKDINLLKTNLECKGEELCKKILNNKNISSDYNDVTHMVSTIITDGMNEYENKTGKKMTYGEMREIYG